MHRLARLSCLFCNYKGRILLTVVILLNINTNHSRIPPTTRLTPPTATKTRKTRQSLQIVLPSNNRQSLPHNRNVHSNSSPRHPLRLRRRLSHQCRPPIPNRRQTAPTHRNWDTTLSYRHRNATPRRPSSLCRTTSDLRPSSSPCRRQVRLPDRRPTRVQRI